MNNPNYVGATNNNAFVVNNQPIMNDVWNFENDWHDGFCSCCEDLNQCNISFLALFKS